MILPNVHNKRRAETSCRIHTRSCVLDLSWTKCIRFYKYSHKKKINWQNKVLTAAKCPAVIDKPMANGAEPFTSERRSSHTPCTTNTRINVISASITTP